VSINLDHAEDAHDSLLNYRRDRTGARRACVPASTQAERSRLGRWRVVASGEIHSCSGHGTGRGQVGLNADKAIRPSSVGSPGLQKCGSSGLWTPLAASRTPMLKSRRAGQPGGARGFVPAGHLPHCPSCRNRQGRSHLNHSPAAVQTEVKSQADHRGASPYETAFPA
jgi:hypothetical protein